MSESWNRNRLDIVGNYIVAVVKHGIRLAALHQVDRRSRRNSQSRLRVQPGGIR